VGFLECFQKFERVADFPIWKGTIVDLLMANEPGPEELVREPNDGANDEARGVALSSSPIGSSGDSSWSRFQKEKMNQVGFP